MREEEAQSHQKPHRTPQREEAAMKRALSTLAAAALALLVLAPTASADQVIGSVGSGAGQYEYPEDVAVDTSTGDPESGRVYLADTGNNRVDVFDSSGAFLFAFGWNVNASAPAQELQICTTATGCQKGSAGAGMGQFKGPENIAVDSDLHRIYVSEVENRRIQSFDASGAFVWMIGGNVNQSEGSNLCTKADVEVDHDICGAGQNGEAEGEFLEDGGFRGLPISVGEGGILYVVDSKAQGPFESDGYTTRLQRFSPDGTVSVSQCVFGSGGGKARWLAVSGNGNFYVGTMDPKVAKYQSNCAPFGVPYPIVARGPVSLDGIERVYLSASFEGEPGINQLSADGVLERVLFFPSQSLSGIAEDLADDGSETGVIYAIEQGGGRVVQLTLPDPGPLFVPNTTKAVDVTGVKAKLETTFNPEGKPSTASFEYLPKESFVNEGEEFKGPNLRTTPDSLPSPGGFENQTVFSTNVCTVPNEPTCLEPQTDYVFRAIAKNADGEVKGDVAEFTTPPPHRIGAIWSTEVGTDTARLHAEVNPLGVAATAHFEYVTAEHFEAEGFANAASTPSIDLGAGNATLTRASQLQGLERGTTYRYRFVAEDAFFEPTISESQALHTFALPEAGQTDCPNQAFRTGPSAALPDCRAYEMVTPLDKDNGDLLTRINLTGYETNLDKASIDGNAFAFTSYRAFSDPKAAPYTNQYLAERGLDGWSSENLSPPRTGHFADELENQFQAFSPDLTKAWMLQEGEPTLDPCAAPGVSGLYRRDSDTAAYEALSCSPVGKPAKDIFKKELPQKYMPEFQGASADGTKALIRMDDQLLGEASKATVGDRPVYQTYLSVGEGALRLVSTLPDGTANPTDSSAGTALEDNVPNHNRFNRVATAISADGTRVFWTAGTGSGTLYLRLNADQEQSPVQAGACTDPALACTVPVSGTVTDDRAQFQAANPEGTEALFTVTQGPLAGNLYRFDASAEPPGSELIAEGVIGSILGASEDLSSVYYVSTAANAQQQSEGAVAGKRNIYLAEGGEERFAVSLMGEIPSPLYGTVSSNTPIRRTARVNPDGSALVFMSNSAELAEQSAGYDNTDINSGMPAAEVYRYEAASGEVACVSCNPSGGRPLGQALGIPNPGEDPIAAAVIPRPQNQLHQGRYLSNDGSRVFFDSFEALSLADTNGKRDVYQWEAAGTGSCATESPTFVESSKGCLSLVSSGQSPDNSAFLDASPSGEDVFFSTSEGLVEQDYGLIDVYDARVGGGYPPPPEPPAACEGEACQGPPATPNDATPASSTYRGAGNVAEEKPKAKRCPKGKVRRKGRCVKKKPKATKNRTAHRNGRKQR
jgi:hypothetical protein